MMLNNYVLLMVWWLFINPEVGGEAVPPGCSCKMFWPYFCSERSLSWILHLHLNKRPLNICTAVQGLILVRYSIWGLKQKPSLFLIEPFFRVCPSFLLRMPCMRFRRKHSWQWVRAACCSRRGCAWCLKSSCVLSKHIFSFSHIIEGCERCALLMNPRLCL